MRPLTPNQSRVLEVFATLYTSSGQAPTVRAIATSAGLSHGYTYYVLRKLESKGRLERRPYAHRGLRLTGAEVASS